MTAAITHWLIARQMPDGQWLGNGVNRPPSEYSSISHTAIAAAGLTSYPLPGPQEPDRAESATGTAVAARSRAEISRRTRDAADGPGVDRCAATPCRGRGPRYSGAAGRRRRVVAVRPHRAGCLRDRTVAVCAVRRRRSTDRRRIHERRGVPARHAVSGRHLAREDPFLSDPAILRKRVSVRPAPVDICRRNELGRARHCADAARTERLAADP